jgi:hypothetical protein
MADDDRVMAKAAGAMMRLSFKWPPGPVVFLRALAGPESLPDGDRQRQSRALDDAGDAPKKTPTSGKPVSVMCGVEVSAGIEPA